ncbi:hypothetical protein [Thermoactinomyces mirandus]|uniref:Uncharacterized protein n=1 Tax=Thermoactinomyces mirandus TaxID=2756294 RepID=A0A7W1XUI7_9BACL|nr:hypothetical protein [Thermoactinomyces mirandus]MBA4603543.1 hypothetical protein [Thermoactinomyces mirandus]
MKKAVGFDQKIMLHHLDFTANAARTTEIKEMYEKLHTCLAADIYGEMSRKHAITMLMKIWVRVDEEHKEIQKQALKLFPTLTSKERILLHYGMTLLAYPFFKDVVTEIGVLSRIQDQVPSSQIYRRIKAMYGDRRRVEVAVSAVLTSLRFWGVIDSRKTGIEPALPKLEVTSPMLKRWLVQVIVKAAGQKVMPLDLIREQPMLFPFHYWIEMADLSKEQFEVNRQGLDMIVVGLRSGKVYEKYVL